MSQNRARNKNRKKDKLICYCNSVPLAVVQDVIDKGAKTMGEIFDRTTAGCGACGGTCQPDIKRLLNEKKKS